VTDVQVKDTGDSYALAIDLRRSSLWKSTPKRFGIQSGTQCSLDTRLYVSPFLFPMDRERYVKSKQRAHPCMSWVLAISQQSDAVVHCFIWSISFNCRKDTRSLSLSLSLSLLISVLFFPPVQEEMTRNGILTVYDWYFIGSFRFCVIPRNFTLFLYRSAVLLTRKRTREGHPSLYLKFLRLRSFTFLLLRLLSWFSWINGSLTSFRCELYLKSRYRALKTAC